MVESARKKASPSPDRIARGSGNIFSDLGLPNAKEQQTKLRLAYAINKIANERNLTQAGVAKALGVPQPKISSLKNYKLDGFSVERLMVFLTALGHDVDISIRKRVTSPGTAKITVVAA
jgi:predicted XRE-type DNA-binding protein